MRMLIIIITPYNINHWKLVFYACKLRKLNLKEVFNLLCDRYDMHRHSGLALLTIASIALTVPFIYYAKDIADSIRVIAERR